MNIRSYLYRSRELDELRRRVKAMAQALGGWNRELEEAEEAAILYGDEDYLEFITKQLEGAVAEQGVEVHPFMPDPDPGEANQGEIFLGRTSTGGECRVWRRDLSYNVLVVAAPGRGKTTLVCEIIRQAIESGISAQVFDTANEYADVLAPIFAPEVLQIVDARDFRINPFDPPGHVTAREWIIDLLPRTLRFSQNWRERTTEMYRFVCLALLESHEEITPGIFAASYRKLVPKSKQYFSEFASLERFGTMLKTVPTFQCVHGERIRDEKQPSRIYVMKDYPDDGKLFLVTLLSQLHYVARDYERNRPLDLVLVFDELSSFFTKETLSRYKDISEPFYLSLLRADRKMGLGTILADQTYNLIHDVARSNCQTKILLDIRDGRSRREAAWDLGMSREQEEFLGVLSWKQPNRRAVVQLHDYPYPILINIPVVAKPLAFDEAEMKARLEAGTKAMEWEPVPDTRTGESPRPPEETFLEPMERKILGVVGCNHFLSHEEYAEKLKMPESTFSKWARRLKENGYLKEVPIHLGRQGAAMKLLVPTDDGHACLDKQGISYRPIPGNGGPEHRWWQHCIWSVERQRGDLGGVEYTVNDKRIDVAIIRGEERIAYEVVWSDDDLEKEVSNYNKDTAAGFSHIIFGVQSEDIQERLAMKLEDADKRVEIRLLKELGDKYRAMKRTRSNYRDNRPQR